VSSPTLSPPRPSFRPRHRPPGAPATTTFARPLDPAAPAAEPTGRFRYDRRTGAWWWSAEMYALHGVVAGAPVCTETLLERQYPDDRPRVLAALTNSCATGRPFTVRSRVLHGSHGCRDVVLVGEPTLGPDGSVTAIEGMCVDLSGCPSPDAPTAQVAALRTEIGQLHEAMASRAVIEQAKGVLMLLTTCTDTVAFELLIHMSSHTHRKVREVAAQIAASAAGAAALPDDVRAILRDACPPAHALA
jgi:hypothetical protein